MNAKGKILVVDDDRLVLATVAHGLAQAGYDVIDADNGDDAILLARKHKPELALLDIRMEGKSGFDVAEYLRDYGHVPFIFLSAFSDADTVAQVAALGAVAYMVKPLDVGQIVPTVEAAFERLRAQRAAAAVAGCGGRQRGGGVAGRRRADAPLFAVAPRSAAAAASHRRRRERLAGRAGRAPGARGRRTGPPRCALRAERNVPPKGDRPPQATRGSGKAEAGRTRSGSPGRVRCPPWGAAARRPGAVIAR